jgi:hypothetical protein
MHPLTAAALALLLAAACSPADRGPELEAGIAAVALAPEPAAAAPDGTPQEGLPDESDPALFLALDTLRWASWETRPPADRMARLRELGITPVRDEGCRLPAGAPRDDHTCGERWDDFRFVDFSGDGVDDVVYAGPWFRLDEQDGLQGLEGHRVRLYQVIAGRGVQVLDLHGQIQRVWAGRPGHPATFRSVRYGCCADPFWAIEYFRPALAGDTVRYEVHHRVAGREGIEIPDRFLDAPRRFTVRTDGYLLRATPQVLERRGPDEEDWMDWPGRGNALAEYGAGARGTALAERADGTGRVWWFVRMDPATQPRDAQIGAESGAPFERIGWMSSRFLDTP